MWVSHCLSISYSTITPQVLTRLNSDCKSSIEHKPRYISRCVKNGKIKSTLKHNWSVQTAISQIGKTKVQGVIAGRQYIDLETQCRHGTSMWMWHKLASLEKYSITKMLHKTVTSLLSDTCMWDSCTTDRGVARKLTRKSKMLRPSMSNEMQMWPW